jgi:predicted TIM-barrel fold metal-dependent hydrolase
MTTEAPSKTLVVDGDGHLLEPADLWTRNVSSKFREVAPRLFVDGATGDQGWIADGPVIIRPPRAGDVGNARWSPERRRLDGVGSRYEEGPPAGFDPDERVKEQDQEGIDLAFMYPTLGLFLPGVRDPELAVECCRIYNDWLADWCGKYPDRFRPIGALPLQDPEAATREARRCVERLGMRGFFVRPCAYAERYVHDPAFDPVWAVAQEAGVPVGLHPGGTAEVWGAPQLYGGRWGRIPGYKVFTFLFDNYFALTAMVGTGVLERFPRLKLIVLESGGGWLFHWLDQLDHWLGEVQPQTVDGLSLLPSGYFARQIYISVDPDERSVPYLVDAIGDHKIMWASDYPHTDVTVSSVVAEVREHVAKLPERAQRRILGENARAIYGLAGG